MVYDNLYFGKLLQAPIYQTTWHHISEDSSIHSYDDNHEWLLGRTVTDPICYSTPLQYRDRYVCIHSLYNVVMYSLT
jgi:hypothetical protein